MTKSDFLNVIITELVKIELKNYAGTDNLFNLVPTENSNQSVFAPTIILQNNLFPALLQQPFPWSQILFQQQYQQKPKFLGLWWLGRLDSRQLNLTTLRHFISPPPSILPSEEHILTPSHDNKVSW